ncbi:MAG: PQQ-binding-like beta-propeller repeat protein [Planctomycetes bacterium]|nr:PQQ-binding-like beta-propeller repeat protein [Planctomycetota bacterium]
MANIDRFSFLRCAVLLLLSGLCYPYGICATESDWPMWRHDASRSAASALKLPGELYLQWKRELPAPRPAFPNDPRLRFDVSYEPIVLGKRIYVPSMVTDSLTALATDTGMPQWTFFANGPIRLAPLAWEDKVYCVSDDGCLYCLDAANGRLLWKFRAVAPDRAAYRLLGNERLISRWPARGGPVLADGIVYFGAGVWPFEGVFVCAVNAQTGEPVWVNRESDFIKDGLLDHGTRRDGGLSPQGYLAMIGGRLVVPSGRALPGFFDPKSGQVEPYTTGWGGRIALAKGCWYACGTDDYLFQSGDVYGLTAQPASTKSASGDLVSLSDFAQRMDVPPETVDRWVKDLGLATVEQEGKRFLRTRTGDPITYLSWWTNPPRPGERHSLESRIRLQIDPANVKELGVFREPVLTKTAIYYSRPERNNTKRIQDEDRRPPTEACYLEIVASNITGPPKADKAYQGGWGGRLVEWPVAAFDRQWHLASQLKVHIKSGQRLYAGGPGTIAAVDIPSTGQQAKVSWQTQIEGTPTRMLAADDKLFVVTGEGTLFCFGEQDITPKTYVHAIDRADTETRSDPWTAKAERILKLTGVENGYCLALGLGSGRLAEELVHQSELHVIVIESNAEKVAAARRKLHEMGLYGSRVHVLSGDLDSLRLPPFMASVVVAENLSGSTSEEEPPFAERLFDILRPYGGVACLPISKDRHAAFAEHVRQAKLASAKVTRSEDLTLLTREGALPNSADWPHESGDSAHTFASNDRLAKPPFGVLWFGGELDRVIPLIQGPPPRIASGRMFLHVGNELHAADIYTGRHLWKRTVSGLKEYIAADNGVYAVCGQSCLLLDPATGAQKDEIPVPRAVGQEKSLTWKQIRIWGDYFVGEAGKQLVCVDRHSGELRWKFECQRDGFGFAVGADKVFCIDYWLPARRRRGEPKTEEGTICALDVSNGDALWHTTTTTPAEDTTQQTSLDSPSFLNPQLAYSEPRDVLVFTRNRSTAAAYRGATGDLIWSQDIPCKDPPSPYTGHHPPILLPDMLVTHGGKMIDLLTGRPRVTRLWKGMNSEMRGCGRALGSPHLVSVRDGDASYFDLANGSHVYFRGIRSGCTNSLIPAGGILNAPNFGRHCTCNWPLSASLALVTMPEAAVWDRAGSD